MDDRQKQDEGLKAAVRTWEPKNIPETKDEDDYFWKAVERLQEE